MSRKLAKADIRATKPDRCDYRALPRKPLRFVLDGAMSTFNFGAIIRIADAFRCEGLIVKGAAREGRHLHKTSRGTERWVDVEYCDHLDGPIQSLKEQGYAVIALELTHDAEPLQALVRYVGAKVAVVLGDESHGVSESVLALADATALIPMQVMGNSINVSSAAAIGAFFLL